MLFGSANSYMGVTESLDDVMENWRGREVEPTSRAFAEIMREGAEDLAKVESAVYVADVLIESQIIDGVITESQAQVVAEGAIKDFLSKVVEKLKKLFNKVKDWFVSIGKKFKVYSMKNKDFVKKYETEIREKARSSELEFKTYDYKLDAGKAKLKAFSETVKKELEKLCGAISDIQDVDSWTKQLNNKLDSLKVDEDGKITETFWDKCKYGSSWADVKEEVMDEFHNGDSDTLAAKELPISEMITYLKNGVIEKEISDGYKKVSDAYNRSIKDLERAEKAYGRNESNSDDNKTKVASFVRATASNVSSFTSLLSNCSELEIQMCKEFYSASAKICKALVTRKEVKESYSGSSILEGALNII